MTVSKTGHQNRRRKTSFRLPGISPETASHSRLLPGHGVSGKPDNSPDIHDNAVNYLSGKAGMRAGRNRKTGERQYPEYCLKGEIRQEFESGQHIVSNTTCAFSDNFRVKRNRLGTACFSSWKFPAVWTNTFICTDRSKEKGRRVRHGPALQCRSILCGDCLSGLFANISIKTRQATKDRAHGFSKILFFTGHVFLFLNKNNYLKL